MTPTPAQLLRLVARLTGIPTDTIMDHRLYRFRRVTTARKVLMLLMQGCGYTIARIAYYMGRTPNATEDYLRRARHSVWVVRWLDVAERELMLEMVR